MEAVLRIAERIADNSPTAVQSVKRAVQMGHGEPVEQAVAIMMDEHWFTPTAARAFERSPKAGSGRFRILTFEE